MLGKAMDTTMPGMPMSQIREIGMRMQRGGVGYYPNAGTPFVHLDVGNVRHWPRMSYDELARLFPDGKTVHLPTNGQPLARYEEARAEIEARGDGAYVVAPRRTFGGFFAMLFGGGGSGGEEDDAEVTAPAPSARKQWASLAPRTARGASGESEEEGVASAGADANRYRAPEIARAEADLPRGETTLSAPGAEPPEQEPSSTKRPTVRAPLPPQRPASLTAFTDKQMAYDRSAALAAVDQSREPQSAVEFQESDGVAKPPRRSTLASAPLPPSRPAALRAKATSAIARLVESPKTEARKSRSAAQQDSLAYAPEPNEQADKTDEIARSSRNGAVEEPASHGAVSLMGPTGLRSAARARGRGQGNKEVIGEEAAKEQAR
jgi:hypothetical protein